MKQICLLIAAAGWAIASCACMTGTSQPPAGMPQEVHVHLDTNATYVQPRTTEHGEYEPSNSPQAPGALLKEINEAYRNDAYARVLRTAHTLLLYPGATTEQRAQALTYAGAISFAHGEEEKARAYFQKALEQDPGAFPEERIRTSAMVELFLDIRNDLNAR